MKKKKPLIGILGPNGDKCDAETYMFAFELGAQLAAKHLYLVSGGKLGIMEAAFKGVKSISGSESLTIGIIPEEEKKWANDFCDVVIPTGIGTARNKIIINTSDILIAIGGGAGTLSEMAFAWQMNKPIIAYTGFDGWAKELAGKAIDERGGKLVYSAKNINEIIELVHLLMKKSP